MLRSTYKREDEMNIEKLKALKEEKDIYILAHYYVDGEVKEIADEVGDSFVLAQKAKTVPQKNIVMAGVYFMGESIKILSPEKMVIMPDIEADCPMAHMITAERIQEMREKVEDLAVVCYINSTAEIKAHSDVIVTSSNVKRIIDKLEEKNIFFIPDKNLGKNIAGDFPDKNFITDDGHCPVHDQVTTDEVMRLKEEYPNAKVLAHPEATPEVIAMADFSGSTSGILAAAQKMDADELIIVTEEGIRSDLENLCPGKKFYFPTGMLCEGMKRVTIDKVLDAVENGGNKVEVDPETIERAYKPLARMLELGRA